MKLIRKLLDSGAATQAQVDAAQRLFEDRGGILATWLMDTGVAASKVMEAMSTASGYPVAGLLDMARASLPSGLESVPTKRWFAFRAVPIGEEEGRIRVAIPTPELAMALSELGLPKLAPILALETDIRTVQARLFGPPPTGVDFSNTDPLSFDADIETQAFDPMNEDTVRPAESDPFADAPQTLVSGEEPELDEADAPPTIAMSSHDLAAHAAADRFAASSKIVDEYDDIDDVDLDALEAAALEVADEFDEHNATAVSSSYDDDPVLAALAATQDPNDFENQRTSAMSREELLAMAKTHTASMQPADPPSGPFDQKTTAMAREELLAIASSGKEQSAEPQRTTAMARDQLLEMAGRADSKPSDGASAPGDFDEPTFAMDAELMQASIAQMHGLPIPPSDAGEFDEPTVAAPDLLVHIEKELAVAPTIQHENPAHKKAAPPLPAAPAPKEQEDGTIILDIDDQDDGTGLDREHITSVEVDFVDDNPSVVIDNVSVEEMNTANISLAARARELEAAAEEQVPGGPYPNVQGYRIRDILGEGGMATVYLADDLKKKQPVALKVMAPELSDDDLFVERFKRETRAASSLKSEHVLKVFDYGSDGTHWFMATEVMDGGTLRAMVKQNGRVPAPLAVVCFDQLIRGLSRAHQDGVIHRDIKPGNIMLSSSGLVKIGDFGIAKMDTDSSITRTGALFGTPAYMSPEQTLGRQLDGRSDLFSAGIILYEMLAGLNPYVADSPSATLLRVSRASAPSVLAHAPGVPRALLNIVERIQRRDPNTRYQNAQQVLDDLAPLTERSLELFPTMIADYVANPTRIFETMRARIAKDSLALSRSLMVQVPARAAEAAYWAHAARRSSPNDDEAERQLDRISAEHRFNFEPPRDPRIHEAERELDDSPDDQEVILRLADLYREVGNPHLSAAYRVQFLRRNDDKASREEVDELIGRSELAPLAPILDVPRDEEPPTPGQTDWGTPAIKPIPAQPSLAITPLPVQPSPPVAQPPYRPPVEQPMDELAYEPLSHGYANAGEDPVVIALMEEMKKAQREQQFGGMKVFGADSAPAIPPQNLVPYRPSSEPQRLPNQLPEKEEPVTPANTRVVVVVIVAIVFVIAAAGGVWSMRSRIFSPASTKVDRSQPVDAQQSELLARGRAFLATGNANDALTALNEAIRLDPASAPAIEALLPRARAHLALGNSNFAKADLEQVVSSLPPGNLYRLEAQQLLGSVTPN